MFFSLYESSEPASLLYFYYLFNGPSADLLDCFLTRTERDRELHTVGPALKIDAHDDEVPSAHSPLTPSGTARVYKRRRKLCARGVCRRGS